MQTGFFFFFYMRHETCSHDASTSGTTRATAGSNHYAITSACRLPTPDTSPHAVQVQNKHACCATPQQASYSPGSV